MHRCTAPAATDFIPVTARPLAPPSRSVDPAKLAVFAFTLGWWILVAIIVLRVIA